MSDDRQGMLDRTSQDVLNRLRSSNLFAALGVRGYVLSHGSPNHEFLPKSRVISDEFRLHRRRFPARVVARSASRLAEAGIPSSRHRGWFGSIHSRGCRLRPLEVSLVPALHAASTEAPGSELAVFRRALRPSTRPRSKALYAKRRGKIRRTTESFIRGPPRSEAARSTNAMITIAGSGCRLGRLGRIPGR